MRSRTSPERRGRPVPMAGRRVHESIIGAAFLQSADQVDVELPRVAIGEHAFPPGLSGTRLRRQQAPPYRARERGPARRVPAGSPPSAGSPEQARQAPRGRQEDRRRSRATSASTATTRSRRRTRPSTTWRMCGQADQAGRSSAGEPVSGWPREVAEQSPQIAPTNGASGGSRMVDLIIRAQRRSPDRSLSAGRSRASGVALIEAARASCEGSSAGGGAAPACRVRIRRPGRLANRARMPVDVLAMTDEWRARRDSNSRPSGPQPDALSTELRAHRWRRRRVAEREGFEPSEQVTPLGGLANRCTRPLCDLSEPQRRACYHRAEGLPADRPRASRPTGRALDRGPASCSAGERHDGGAALAGALVAPSARPIRAPVYGCRRPRSSPVIGARSMPCRGVADPCLPQFVRRCVHGLSTCRGRMARRSSVIALIGGASRRARRGAAGEVAGERGGVASR